MNFDTGFWVLDEQRRPRLADAREWAPFFAKIENRRVAFSELAPGITVSTVFLGVDHSISGGAPLLFETMSFGTADDDQVLRRYTTWDAADLGHADVCAELSAAIASGRVSAQPDSGLPVELEGGGYITLES